jgi:tetratricopeptide (TPR) repeat protein
MERSLGRDRRALDLFQKAIADDANDLNARHNLALLFVKRGDDSLADDLWRGNLERDAQFTISRIAYAESLARRSNRKPAIEQYEILLRDKPAFAPAREALARLYLEENELARALALLSESTASTLELRGDVKDRMGDYVAAKTDWKAALDSTSDRDARSRLQRKIRGRAH